MKKLILTLVGAMMTISLAVAQNYQKNIYGVYAGLNVAKLSVNTNSKLGFHVGGSYERLLMNTHPLYLETGIQFTQKGYSLDDEYSGNASYLEIPVMVNYKFHFGNTFSLYPSAGIYYAFGVGGKTKEESDKYDMFGKMGEFKRSDLGIRVGVTFGIKRFNIGLGYEFGLMNISKGWDDDYIDYYAYEEVNDYDGFAKAKNGNLFISIGYKF